MATKWRRTRRVRVISHLPRRGYIIREKYLRRFRNLARQLTDTPMSRDTTFDGLLHMGDEGNEIWIDAGLSEPEKRFTVVHELVHARRQRSGEDLDDEGLEEAIVELEAVARVGTRTLRRMPSGMLLTILHKYLTGDGRHDPETLVGLRAVNQRILTLLQIRTRRGETTTAVVAARRRPKKTRRSKRR